MRKLLGIAAVLCGVTVLYRRVLREPILNWGASLDEATSRLPGDELLEGADLVATRATTIVAPPSAVWPWLVQMGPDRGGAYTYDWIENLFGIGMHSVDEIRPEWQQLEVGDLRPVMPNGPAMRVEILEPERILSMRSEDGTWVWTFLLEQHDGATRLVSRNRIVVGPSLGAKLGMLVQEPGSLVMERKMLRGIKERAEKLARA